jgi:predicted nuclease of predicted toxin-antitoxin system
MMNLLADEGMDRPVVDRLRREGHAVLYVADMTPGITDDEVLDEANRQGALLVTGDKDFGELVYRLGRVHQGVVLVRLAGLPLPFKADVVARAIHDHEAELPGAFTVISRGQVRIRRTPSP